MDPITPALQDSLSAHGDVTRCVIRKWARGDLGTPGLVCTPLTHAWVFSGGSLSPAYSWQMLIPVAMFL